MLYLSSPNGTHAVFIGTRSQGAYDIVKLKPGWSYREGRPPGDFVGERDFFTEAKDGPTPATRATPKGRSPKLRCWKRSARSG